MRISDWSSDVCSSDLRPFRLRINQVETVPAPVEQRLLGEQSVRRAAARIVEQQAGPPFGRGPGEQRARLAAIHVGHIAGQEDDRRPGARSEEHTSELQSLMRISYAVFCLKKKQRKQTCHTYLHEQ